MKKKPTLDMYGFVQAAYDHFNNTLFNSELPQCMLTFQREKNVMGYFANSRWEGADGKQHEIALNPCYFITHRPLELFQTIVHEMCHLWQHEFGTPSRRTYHNKEWADKMEGMGLMPSDTGEPGGKRTGQKMGDYPIKNGLFLNSCITFANQGNNLPFVDIVNVRYDSSQIRQQIDNVFSDYDDSPNEVDSITETNAITVEDIDTELTISSLSQPFSVYFNIDEIELEEARQTMAKRRKTTFVCPGCGDKAWGKPSLLLVCGKCRISLNKECCVL